MFLCKGRVKVDTNKTTVDKDYRPIKYSITRWVLEVFKKIHIR